VHGGGQGDVGRVMGVAREAVVIEAAAALQAGRAALRSEGEGLDPRSGAAAGVEVQADKDAARRGIRDAHTPTEGHKGVIRAGKDDFESFLLQGIPHGVGHAQGEILLIAINAPCADIVPAMPGIHHHRVKGFGIRDVGRTKDGVDELAKIEAGEQGASAGFEHREAQDELDVVDQHFLTADGGLQDQVVGPQPDVPAIHLVGAEAVEVVDAFARDVIPPVHLHHLPARVLGVGGQGLAGRGRTAGSADRGLLVVIIVAKLTIAGFRGAGHLRRRCFFYLRRLHRRTVGHFGGALGGRGRTFAL